MKMQTIVSFGAALLMSAAIMTTPAMSASKSGDNSPITDTWLTSKVKIALFADSRVKGRQINVETQNGEAILRGKVDSDQAKDAAQDIAKMVDGVKSVKNELQVVPPAQREMVEEKDDAINDRVKDSIKKDSKLSKSDIDVKTHDGVVSLTGEVPDITTSAHASLTAWIVPGVKSVKNDLMVKEDK